MRLIDADALKNAFNVFYGGVGHAAIASWIINDAPTVDAVEVVHGEWIEDGYYDEPCVCSYCGEPCRDTVMGKPRWNFCPRCGADMRERKPND